MNNDFSAAAAADLPVTGRFTPAPASAPLADPELLDNWSALRAAEDAAIAARRLKVLGEAAAGNMHETDLPRVGMALSGGGVRSATFALGLMRGMAQGHTRQLSSDPAKRTLVTDGLLGRLDYLSTVSGGGYTGGMYGRLVATYGLQCAQALMARGGSPVLDWLRRNGRYLTPSGSRDLGIAVVTYLRAWLAIHIEFMFACIFLGLVVVGPHLWQHSVQLLSPTGWERWHTPWWAVALAFFAALAPGLVAGYWAARDAPDLTARRLLPCWRDALFLATAAIGAWLLWRAAASNGGLDPVSNGLNLPTGAVLAAGSLVAGQLVVMLWMLLSREPHALRVARLRNWLTRALRQVALIALGLAALGALDRLSWWLLEELQTKENPWLWGGVGAGGVAVVVLRTLMQPLQQIASKADNRTRDWLPRLLDIGSLLGLLALVTAWLVVIQWFVFAPSTLRGLSGLPPLLRAGLFAAFWLGWVALTSGNSQMANTSSLHSFYRARLTRAYLAVGNRQRSMNTDESSDAGIRADVTRVVEGDDTRLRSYRPELEGGPIHLINTCLNQTRDDKSGLYNADRKGAAVTATWRGFEMGPREFVAFRDDQDAGTLGRWVAVSGAAASPGAGSYTSRGLALLVYFLGVRLGHWMRAPQQRVELRWLSRLAWRAIPKPMMLTSEASATFFGVERPWWYLSDGGHFENSGVYALIKREVGFIILSDGSSDGDYEFGDIENLVRKARIDFGAEIDFYSHDEAESLFTLSSSELTVLSPEHMANNHSCRGVLLARIRYRERAGPRGKDGSEGKPFRPEGTLLVIKPNLHDALDVDLIAYARKHEKFPHESTGDQSFDEAQWESYHRLGEDFGRALHESWLAQLPGWRSPARHSIRVAARLGASGTELNATRSEPLWRRGVRAAAIGTTVGLGATGTLLLSLWQVQDQVQKTQAAEQAEAHQLFVEASKGVNEALEGFDASCPAIKDSVFTQILQLKDMKNSPNLLPPDTRALERIVGKILGPCLTNRDTTRTPSCLENRDRFQAEVCGAFAERRNTTLNYWYPGTSAKQQAAESRLALARVASQLPVVGSAFRPGSEDLAVAGIVDYAYGGGPEGAGRQASGTVAESPLGAAGGTVGAVGAGQGSGSGFGGGYGSSSGGERPTGASSASLPVTAPAPIPPTVSAAANAAAPVLPREVDFKVCQRNAGRGNSSSTLYIQIYEESARAPATALRQTLQTVRDLNLVVSPIENVTRSADLRQQRRPVPWPRPTLLLHDPNSRACANAIARYIGAPWVPAAATAASNAGGATGIRIRELPASLQAQPGVIELWLPPAESLLSKEDVKAGVVVSRLDLAR
jgi:hypothetical protein